MNFFAVQIGTETGIQKIVIIICIFEKILEICAAVE